MKFQMRDDAQEVPPHLNSHPATSFQLTPISDVQLTLTSTDTQPPHFTDTQPKIDPLER